MKLSARSQQLLFITLMVLAMSFIISLVMSLLNAPTLSDFSPARWLKNWLISMLVAWPTAYVVVPAVRRIVSKFA
jgi:antibiotic biosynthesis monooxygenase (ABM) superfamily enzyme